MSAAATVAAAESLPFDLQTILLGLRFVGEAHKDRGSLAMPPRTAKQILAEWHELAIRREEAADSDIDAGLAARIEQLRREYIEGTPPGTPTPTATDGDEPKVQMKLPL